MTDRPNAAGRETRYLIVSDGRTGTTLLTSILGIAGADFGYPVEQDWDASAGANEDDDLMPVTHLLERAEAIDVLWRRVPGLGMIRRFYRSRAKHRVRRLMGRAVFHKAANGYFPAYAFKVGFDPRVIVSFRRFDSLMRSKLLQQRMGYPQLADRMLSTYRNAIIAVHTFGGCFIDYDELTDLDAVDWAAALAEVTGLDRDGLVRAREQLVKSSSRGSANEFDFDPELGNLYQQLSSMSGKAYAPSGQYLRHIGAKTT